MSALGNVISALSTGEKFIPYRDNKLTMVRDREGGTAKEREGERVLQQRSNRRRTGV